MRAAVPRCCEDARLAEDGLERLMAHTLDWLVVQVPAVAATFSPVDRRLSAFTTGPAVARLDAPRLRLQAREAHLAYVRAYHAVDPFAPRRWTASAAAVVGVGDVGGQAAFARTRYAAFLAELGLGTQVSLHLRDEGRIVAVIALFRGSSDRGFAPAEIAQLRRAQPFLEHAYALARRRPASEARDGALSHAGLTVREREVARLIATGATNAEIARALFVSLPTVKTHVSRVLAKLGARSRTELAFRLAQPRAPGS